jgi:hypothetical protein
MSECMSLCEHSRWTCVKEVGAALHTGHMLGLSLEYRGCPGELLQKNLPYVPFSHCLRSGSVTLSVHSGESAIRFGHFVVVVVIVKRPSSIIA